MTQGIQEKSGTLPAIEAERHLIQIGRKMLGADFVPRSDDAALEQRECGLNRVSRNAESILVSDVFFVRVIHGLVRSASDGAFVGVQSIGDDHIDIGGDIVPNVLRQSARFRILGVEKSEIPVALTNSNHNFFSLAALEAGASLAPSHIGFVHFDGAIEHGTICFLHGGTDAMAEVPRCLIADSQGSLDLIRGHSLTRLAEQQCGEKPLLERQVRIIEDRAGSHGELIIAFLAVEKLLGGRQLGNWAFTAQAFNAIWPAQAHKQFAAFFIGIEQVYNVN